MDRKSEGCRPTLCQPARLLPLKPPDRLTAPKCCDTRKEFVKLRFERVVSRSLPLVSTVALTALLICLICGFIGAIGIDILPYDWLWYGELEAISDAVGYVQLPPLVWDSVCARHTAMAETAARPSQGRRSRNVMAMLALS